GVHYVPRNDIQALRAKFNKNTAAIFIEPLQGESGIHVVTPEYLQEARRLCDEFGALLVCDEVQCGMGRTGKWFGFEHSGVVPDLITMAKGLGGGVPIAAVLAGRLCADTLVPGDHGSTFAGNPLNATAALTVLDIIESENLIVNSQKTGEHLLIKLNELVDQGLPIVEVRGFGLMVAAELSKPIAKQVVKGCLAKGLILNATGDTSIRILPALTITPEEIDEGLGILAEVLKEIN
ncbi:MAG: aminotransferase class III-fold pyridoxal phosphate-dependent enzyme, partial [bacterium]